MKILHFSVGMLPTNCYLVYDEAAQEGALIDPGDEAGRILEEVRSKKLHIPYILLTHAHFDHILAASEVQRETGAKLVLHKDDAWLLKPENMGAFRNFASAYTEPHVDLWAEDGTSVTFGDLTALYLHTPGHTPGSCTIRVGDVLFTGDTMFRHECGRCDLEGGDFNKMLTSLARLARLPGDYTVLPGHEGSSTLEEERRQNPYVKQALRPS